MHAVDVQRAREAVDGASVIPGAALDEPEAQPLLGEGKGVAALIALELGDMCLEVADGVRRGSVGLDRLFIQLRFSEGILGGGEDD